MFRRITNQQYWRPTCITTAKTSQEIHWNTSRSIVPPSSGYKIVVEPSAFQLDTSSPTQCREKLSKQLTRAVVNLISKNAYFPTTIISNIWSVFVSPVMNDVAEVLGVTMEKAKMKLALTTGMLKKRIFY